MTHEPPPVEDHADAALDADAGSAAFESLLVFLHEERGFDFTGYKRASLARRVERRMSMVGITGFEAYHDYLVLNPDEFAALFDAVLINVTSFFRDLESWDYLRTELLPGVLGADRPLRCWVAGCASGEEAYTLAMVLAETLGVEGVRDRVKIYATDVDEDALATARAATYTAKEVAAVPEAMRERYFDQAGDGRFVVRKELRRAVIFGRNDLVKDAPISHVDVLTCRNTLMYFNAETQALILNRLHFALRPEGVLFLGKAEMLLGHSSYFRPIELRRRFFRKLVTAGRDRLVPRSSTTGFVRESHFDHAHLAQAALMSSSTAQLVLDSDRRLAVANNRALHLCGLTTRDLGRPIQDLEVSYRPIELRAHIEEALQSRRAAWLRDVQWTRETESVQLDIQFVPLFDEAGGTEGVTVIFNDVTQNRQLQNDLMYANRRLESAYEELQSTVEELETTNEELQSTVEELETTNEELQSTNEELETMNEELQSMNDELNTTNVSLREHQDEVSRLNGFMVSILESMDSGVAVVDQELRVMAWNHRAEDLWGVRTDEAVGEHLFNLDIGLPLDGVRSALRGQLTDSTSSPESSVIEAVNRRGRSLHVRVTLTPVQGREGDNPAAMLMMDVVEPDA